MLKAIKNMLYDVRTINALSLEAERLARMAALEDDSARRRPA